MTTFVLRPFIWIISFVLLLLVSFGFVFASLLQLFTRFVSFSLRARTQSEYIFLTHELSDANQFNGNGNIEGENQVLKRKKGTNQPAK